MEADLWTAFTFFGIPLAVGVLGVAHGGRLCYRAYRQYTSALGPEDRPPGTSSPERTWRGHLLRGLPLLVGSAVLVAHAGRWLVRIL